MQRTPSRRPPVGGRVGGQILKKVKILIENSHFGTARKFRFCLTFLSHLYFFSHQNLYLMICFTADSFFQNKDVFPKNQFKLNLLLARFFYRLLPRRSRWKQVALQCLHEEFVFRCIQPFIEVSVGNDYNACYVIDG